MSRGGAAGVRSAAGWGRRNVVGLLAGALVLAGLAAVARDDGFPVAGVDVGGGSVWVASPSVGQLALLSGPSGALAARVKVSDPAQDVQVVQAGETGYAVNRTTGTVTRVDPVSWQTVVKAPLEGARAGLGLAADRTAVFAVDGEAGLVLEADPVTLVRRGKPAGVVGSVADGASVADAQGALWVLDETTGNLVRFADGRTRTWDRAARSGSGRLVLVGGVAAVVDPADDAVRLLGPHGPSSPVCLGVDRQDASVRVGGSGSASVVLTVSGSRGVLLITDVADGRCERVVPAVGAPGQELGVPVEAFGRAFVPNYSTGEVVVVDLATESIVARTPVLDPDLAFQLVARDGFAFYNDPASERSGVISLDGTVQPIAKYDAGAPEEGLFEPGGVAAAPGGTTAGPSTEPPPPVTPPPTQAPPTAGSADDPRTGTRERPRSGNGGGTSDDTTGALGPGAERSAEATPGPGPAGQVTLTVVVVGPDVVFVDDAAGSALDAGRTWCGSVEGTKADQESVTCSYAVPSGTLVHLTASQGTDIAEFLGWSGCDDVSVVDSQSLCVVAASTRTVTATFRDRVEVPAVAAVTAGFSPPSVTVGQSTTLLVTMDTVEEAGNFTLWLEVPASLVLEVLPDGCEPGGTSGSLVCGFPPAEDAQLSLTFTASEVGSWDVNASVNYFEDTEQDTASATVKVTPAFSVVLTIDDPRVIIGQSIDVVVDVEVVGQEDYSLVLFMPNAVQLNSDPPCIYWDNPPDGWVLECPETPDTGSFRLRVTVDAVAESSDFVYAKAFLNKNGAEIESNRERLSIVGPM